MGYRKHNWVSYGRTGEIVEIIMRDSTGAKIESFKCNSKKDYIKILKTIRESYGFDFEEKEEKWLS